jgi:hypothetical protein
MLFFDSCNESRENIILDKYENSELLSEHKL